LKSAFGWKTDNDKKYEFKIIYLTYKDVNDPSHNLEVEITPLIGCNMCGFKVGIDNIIRYDRNPLYKLGFPGNPILYPTPNRVRECEFSFNGITYRQNKKGKDRYLHGLVYDEAWEYDLPEIIKDSVILRAWIDFTKDSPMYESFPFKHRLIIEYILDKTGIKIMYSVDNQDEKDLPFGFALHPFFEKLSGDSGTFITIPADYIMESTSDCLPTGKVLEVDKTHFDMRKPTPVGGLDIDHDYIGMKSSKPSTIAFQDKPFNLSLDTSDEFKNLSLFTPPGKRYFCMKNQTCSTDAHNLYSKGYKKESGLIVVSPGSNHKGFIKYSVHFK